MDNDRLTRIREAERQSHIKTYSETALFQPGSWLAKPVKTVMELLPEVTAETVQILDLGCGIGRNSIPMAQFFAEKIGGENVKIDCVDILELAIEKLDAYAESYHVPEIIRGYVCPLEEFVIGSAAYDLVVGISALEHVKDRDAFLALLHRIEQGVKPGGRICFVLNSGVEERDKETGCKLEPQFEVNLPTEELQEILKTIFAGWMWERFTVSDQRYDIPRDRLVTLTTKVVTVVARKCW